MLKTPIVSYSTGDHILINLMKTLVKTGDYKSMPKNTNLLQNETTRIALAEKAYNYAKNEFSLRVIQND